MDCKNHKSTDDICCHICGSKFCDLCGKPIQGTATWDFGKDEPCNDCKVDLGLRK